MQKIINEKQLLNKLKQDIDDCNKDHVLFLAGHFPLQYVPDEIAAVESIEKWGVFSKYTLHLACVIGAYAQEQKKSVSFVLFVDDHAYEGASGLLPRQRSKRRDTLYRLRSGENASLPKEFERILDSYGFDTSHVLRQDQKKTGRTDCLYFSEKILRSSKKDISNACAREYTDFLDDTKYFDKQQTYLIGFVPNRCRRHICDVVLSKEVLDIDATHVFMETMMPSLTSQELYTCNRGVTYRKDTSALT